MSILNKSRSIAASTVFLALTTSMAGKAQQQENEHNTDRAKESAITIATTPPALDANLYTTYQTDTGDKNLSYVVCGSTQQSEGCYGSGTLGPFGKIGSILETASTISNDVSTSYLLLLDTASGSKQNGVVLHIFSKAQVITDDYDTVTFTQVRSLPLALIGGLESTAFMVANSNIVVIGTNESANAIMISKTNLAVTNIPSITYGENVSAITTNTAGYITIASGNPTSVGSLAVYNSSGQLQEDGGALNQTFMVNSTAGTIPDQVYGGTAGVITIARPTPMLHQLMVRPKVPSSEITAGVK